jgi:hypothetical protein
MPPTEKYGHLKRKAQDGGKAWRWIGKSGLAFELATVFSSLPFSIWTVYLMIFLLLLYLTYYLIKLIHNIYL